MNVFVTDGDQRAALAITRSLGRRGIRVFAGEAAPRSLASSSRYSAGGVAYPSPYRAPEAFVGFLQDFLRAHEIALLIPVTDVTTRIASMHRSAFEERTRVAAPDIAAFDFITDKGALLRRARELMIPTPRTWFVQGPDRVPEIARGLRYPVVVKPCRSWVANGRGWVQARVHYVRSESALRRLYREDEPLRSPSLIQERIVGPGIGVFVLCDRGTVLALFSHRRLRELPPSGGMSVLRESIPVDPALADYAARLLGPLEWSGVAMMEYKVDQDTGRPFLMEVNGRFWGSLQLAIDAGVDFPYLLCEAAMGRPVATRHAYRAGVKTRWLVGDCIHTLYRVFRREAALDLPPRFPSRARTLVSFLKFYEPDLHYEDLTLEDPMPFVHEVSGKLCGLLRRASPTWR